MKGKKLRVRERLRQSQGEIGGDKKRKIEVKRNREKREIYGKKKNRDEERVRGSIRERVMERG